MQKWAQKQRGRREREKTGGEKKTEEREWDGEMVEESGEEEKNLGPLTWPHPHHHPPPPPLPWGLGRPLHCSVLPSLPTDLWLSPAHLPGIPYTVFNPWKKNCPIFSYEMNVLFGQKRKGEKLKWKKSGIWKFSWLPSFGIKAPPVPGRAAGRQQSQQQHWGWRQGCG